MHRTLTVRGDTGALLGDVWQPLLLEGGLQNLAGVLPDAYPALSEDGLDGFTLARCRSFTLSRASSPPGMLQDPSWTGSIRLILPS